MYGDFQDSEEASSTAAAALGRQMTIEDLESEQVSTVEVGEFIADLASAVRFRMKIGQSQGDWVEEPERLFTDGKVFGSEEAVAAKVNLQLTVSLDASSSMWANRIMKHAGPTLMEIDKVVRKAVSDLPGSVTYAPFAFHNVGYLLPAAFLPSYCGGASYKNGKPYKACLMPNSPSNAQLLAAKLAGELPSPWQHRLHGNETKLAPLFQAIKEWEDRQAGTPTARLDIVLTDGAFDDQEDLDEAAEVQLSRGDVRTVMLNFMPPEEWFNAKLPGRCSQHGVTVENVGPQIRAVLTEAIADLL